jgi:mRNA-degrading endonuclease RelE of RelBE toxin-antitoxin system
MTVVGVGGLIIRTLQLSSRFERDFKKLPPEIKALCQETLPKLLAHPQPSGLRFEKLQGYSRPSLYSLHITGNYKVSLEIKGGCAVLRRVACHNEIDRRP